MQEEKFSPQESLELIQSMIAKTRQDVGDRSTAFLLWGWITFIAFVLQFILKHLLLSEKHYLVWLLIIPAIIISFYLDKKQRLKQKANTYVGESIKYLWMGMGISFFILSLIFSRQGWGTNIFPIFMLLYGLGTFVTGKFLQSLPFVMGGIIAWCLAVLATFFDYDYQMLFGAGAILFSYIIPAYLLRRKNGMQKMPA